MTTKCMPCKHKWAGLTTEGLVTLVADQLGREVVMRFKHNSISQLERKLWLRLPYKTFTQNPVDLNHWTSVKESHGTINGMKITYYNFEIHLLQCMIPSPMQDSHCRCKLRWAGCLTQILNYWYSWFWHSFGHSHYGKVNRVIFTKLHTDSEPITAKWYFRTWILVQQEVHT